MSESFVLIHTAEGSVYITGYSIEDPSLSHHPTTSKLLPPSRLSASRKIHCGISTGQKVTALSAGLNYLLASVARHKFLLWGKLPGLKSGNAIREHLTNPSVLDYACGPCELAVLLS